MKIESGENMSEEVKDELKDDEKKEEEENIVNEHEEQLDDEDDSTPEDDAFEDEPNLEEEIAHLNDQLLRNRAELENFKKRMNDERIKDNKYRSQSLVTAILPALDTFEHAISVSTEAPEVKNFLVGFEMIHKQFIDSLANEGVEVIKACGLPFDPKLHQAVAKEEVEGTDPGIVLAEMQKGYKLKDRVIRPSMVKVSQ